MINQSTSVPRGSVALSSLVVSILMGMEDSFREKEAVYAVLLICALDALIQAIVTSKEQIVLIGLSDKRQLRYIFRDVNSEELEELISLHATLPAATVPDDLASEVNLVTEPGIFRNLLKDFHFRQFQKVPDQVAPNQTTCESITLELWKKACAYAERSGVLHLRDLVTAAEQQDYKILPSEFEQRVIQDFQGYSRKEITSSTFRTTEKLKELWAKEANQFGEWHGFQTATAIPFFIVGCFRYCDAQHNVTVSELIKAALIWRKTDEAKWFRRGVGSKEDRSERDEKRISRAITKTLEDVHRNSIGRLVRWFVNNLKTIVESLTLKFPWGIGVSIMKLFTFLPIPSALLPVRKDLRLLRTLIQDAHNYRTLPCILEGKLGMHRNESHAVERIMERMKGRVKVEPQIS